MVCCHVPFAEEFYKPRTSQCLACFVVFKMRAANIDTK